jgi:ubiquitin C-terminal hydrolase
MPLTRAVLKVAWDANIGTPQQGMVKSSGLRSVDPRDVKEAIDVLTDKFAGYEQRDAHEFASTLIDYIHDELVKVTKDRNHVGTLPTDAFFKLDVKVCLTCDSCKYTRYVEMKLIDMLQS